MSAAPTLTPQFAELLARAVTEPGIVSVAYSSFHNYSIGNQLLAWSQCVARGLQPGPLATFPKWKELGRYVRKGEKAITLCQPVTVKKTTQTDDHGGDETDVYTRFVYRPHWFVLSQTDGAEVPPMSMPTWDAARALTALKVTEVRFDATDGNVLGFARARTIAISPINPMPHKTRFHELAHVLLGHTSEGEAGLTDSDMTPRSLREVEAEAVALVCLEALGLPGAEHCRGYIQVWNQRRGAEPIPERSAQRIFKAADQILKAGRAAMGEEVAR